MDEERARFLTECWDELLYWLDKQIEAYEEALKVEQLATIAGKVQALKVVKTKVKELINSKY